MRSFAVVSVLLILTVFAPVAPAQEKKAGLSTEVRERLDRSIAAEFSRRRMPGQ